MLKGTIIDTIKNITNRSNKNKSISITLYETRYVDTHDSGCQVGCVRKTTLITGDCLELRRKFKDVLYCFNIYTKKGENYLLDSNRTLYVGSIFSSSDSLYYSVQVTKQEYQNLLWHKKVMNRNRVVEGLLS